MHDLDCVWKKSWRVLVVKGFSIVLALIILHRRPFNLRRPYVVMEKCFHVKSFCFFRQKVHQNSFLCCWRTWWRRLFLWDASSNNFLICTFMSEYNTEYMLMQIHTEFRGLRTCSVTHLTELKVCKKLKKPNVFY